MKTLAGTAQRIAAELHANGAKTLLSASEADKSFAVAAYCEFVDHDIEILYSLRDLNEAMALGQDFEGFHQANLYAVVESAIGEQVDEALKLLRRDAAREWAAESRVVRRVWA